jgi:hypothetical protein
MRERSHYLEAIISNWKECINVLGEQSRLVWELGCRESQQNLRLGPVRTFLFLRKVIDDMGPDEIVENVLSGMQDSHTIHALLTFGSPNLLLPDFFISAGDSNVDLLDPSEEYKEIFVKCQKLPNERLLLIGFLTVEDRWKYILDSSFRETLPKQAQPCQETWSYQT